MRLIAITLAVFFLSLPVGLAASGWIQINTTDDFTTGSNGWSGGTRDSSSLTYNLSSSFGTIRKTYNFSNSTYELINVTIGKFTYTDGANDPKFFIPGSTASDNDYELLDGTQAAQSWKEVVDGGGYGTDSCSSETWVNGTPVVYTLNKTSRTWKFYHGSTLCSTATSAAIPNGDNLEIANGNGAISIDDVTVWYWGELPADPCSCTGTANCVLNTATCSATTANINVGGYNLTIQGGNTFSINHNITNLQWGFIMSTNVVINATKGGFRWE